MASLYSRKGFSTKIYSEKLREGIKSKLSPAESIVGIYPMNYTDKLIPIDVSKFGGFDIPFIYSTNVKSNRWEYESEWRFIINKAQMGVPFSKVGLTSFPDHNMKNSNRFVKYDFHAIEEICFGWNFFTSENFSIEWNNEMEIKLSHLIMSRDMNII